MEKSRATIHDVAALAQTSATTVSRVLANNYPVKQSLKERVLDAVEELGYVPNTIARSLKSKSVSSIGVVVPTITNPFYSFAVLGMEEEANANGYTMLLCNTLRNPEREKMYLQMLYEKQVQGIILSSICSNGKYINPLIGQGVSIVLLDQKIEKIKKSSYIGYDVRAGAGLAVNHLIARGHRKIAFASSPLTRWSRQEMLHGYKTSLMHAEIPFREEYLLISPEERVSEGEGYEVTAGRAIAAEFAAHRIDTTAILAVNDMLAFGLIRGLERNGIRVPDDVSVIGFDDVPFASLFSPALTTVSYPPTEAGKLAAKVLFEKMNGKGDFDLNVKLEPKLVIRDSVRDLEI